MASSVQYSSLTKARISFSRSTTKLTVADCTGSLHLVYFNQPYLSSALHYGETYRFFGTLQEEPSRQMQNPVFESAQNAGGVTGRLVPVYALTAGLSNNVLQKAIRQALDACLGTLPDILPESVRTEYKLCGVQFAYETIHAPASREALMQARTRLVFEEFFIFSAGLQMLRDVRCDESAVPCDISGADAFEAALPFRLTGAQQRAIRDVLRDMASGRPMNRLVQGDVGSGKTMIAAAAAFCAAKNGLQTAFLVPTEILARQHFASLRALMSCFSIETVLLTGSMPAAEKRRVKEAIASGEAKLILGTHALLSGDVAFQSLGLVIADEQHRFGVGQRAALAAKGRSPHLLVMSATPIPRTLALMIYGDLDVSVLDELPPGRQTVDTFAVTESYRARLNGFIRKQVEEGHQVFVVCPKVEDGEEGESKLKSASEHAEELQKLFPDLTVACVHGRMKPKEKEAVMAAFAAGETDILVSTTVVEVGVDVPNATLMVVENAERFGLSQLHQLRGRVGRGKAKSYCVLVSDTPTEESRERLRVLTRTNNGFEIAQADLELRGPGDFFGSRQHGLPEMHVKDLLGSMDMLHEAQSAAEALCRKNPALAGEELAPLRNRIAELFTANEGTWN